MHLEKKETSSLEEHVDRSDSKDPVYCVIPEKGVNDSGSHYQKLNIANRSSSTLYGKLNSLVYPYEVNLDQSEV